MLIRVNTYEDFENIEIYNRLFQPVNLCGVIGIDFYHLHDKVFVIEKFNEIKVLIGVDENIEDSILEICMYKYNDSTDDDNAITNDIKYLISCFCYENNYDKIKIISVYDTVNKILDKIISNKLQCVEDNYTLYNTDLSEMLNDDDHNQYYELLKSKLV